MAQILTTEQWSRDSLKEMFNITEEDIQGKIIFAQWRVDMNELSANVILIYEGKIFLVNCSDIERKYEGLTDEELDARADLEGLWKPEPITKTKAMEIIRKGLDYQRYYTDRYAVPRWEKNLPDDAAKAEEQI